MRRSAPEAAYFHVQPFIPKDKWSPSPYINRFLSADTIVPSYANPQSLNRYSYVVNNPLRYTDPSGHQMIEDEGSTKGGLDCRKFSKYCNGNHKKSDKELKDMYPKQERKGKDRVPGGGCGSNGILNCPPASSSYPNFSVLEYPSVTLHPSDFLLGDPLVGVTPVYSDEELTGYYEIVYHGSNPKFNVNAVGSLNQWGTTLAGAGIEIAHAISKKITGAVICPECGPALMVIGAVDLANQSITVEGNAHVGALVPVHDTQPLDLSDWQNPFFR